MCTSKKMKKVSRCRSGFSMIELMIVIGIIGILVKTTKPMFDDFRVRAKQVEAKTNAKHIYTLAHTYITENNNLSGAGTFLTASTPGVGLNCNDIDFCSRANGLNFNLPNCKRSNYHYSLQAFANGFRVSSIEHTTFVPSCFATRPVFPGCPGFATDRWVIDTRFDTGLTHDYDPKTADGC